ncbi:hypothetical protein L7F22_033088 [Adiantum nelumboides]|nr:hypothetical protein [Adiantum nelumboides]
MCHILQKAGVAYAWHDGVCIKQHNDKELTATIESMGWIYSMAKETIVFLHYVGKPMAPVSPRESDCELVCRWHTRVWTLQEAALSKKRRYCVRVCNPPSRFHSFYRLCHTLKKLVKKFKEFEEAIALWYRFESSEIDVITEERFMVDFIQEAEDVSCHLMLAAQRMKEKNYSMLSASNDALGLDCWHAVINSWYSCLKRLKDTLKLTCLGFPTLDAALVNCSRRDSKHVGDRINSVLTLTGLKGFVAPKDFQEGNDTMEGWTIEFFNQQGQGGLAWALFCLNVGRPKVDDDLLRTRTWVPMLWRPIREPEIVGISDCTKSWGIKFEVCQDKRLQLEGELECISLRFTLKLKEILPVKFKADNESLGNEDVCTDDLLIASEHLDKACTDSDQYSFGEDAGFSADKLHVDDATLDGTFTDQQVSELEVDEESEGEQDEEDDDDNLEDVAQNVKGKEMLDLELNVSVEGFIDSFLVRFLDTDIIMGTATFFFE